SSSGSPSPRLRRPQAPRSRRDCSRRARAGSATVTRCSARRSTSTCRSRTAPGCTSIWRARSRSERTSWGGRPRSPATSASRRALEALDRGGLAAPEIRRSALAHCAWAEAVAGDADSADELLAQVGRLLGQEESDDLLDHTVEHARALALIRRGRFAESY